MFRLKHHEFWNTHIFHFPIYCYWLYLSIRARSLFFFSAANPGIETGGLIGESKFGILRKIHPRFLPKTTFFEKPFERDQMLRSLSAAGIQYPFVAKPDVGQGGWLIELIRDDHDFENFLNSIRIPFIIQEYVDDPLEFGLLYYRLPGASQGVVSSLAIKHLLSIEGDGIHSIRALMKKIPRAARQLQRLQNSDRVDLDRIPAKGEKVPLSFVGNHSYGTAFEDAGHLIDAKMTEVFDSLCVNIEGFYFGRFDLRCKSLEALREGDFKILELNGVGSEPLHIFDPRTRLLDAYASAFDHWRTIFRISRLNRKNIFSCMNLKQAWDTYKSVMRIQRIHHTNFTIGN